MTVLLPRLALDVRWLVGARWGREQVWCQGEEVGCGFGAVAQLEYACCCGSGGGSV